MEWFAVLLVAAVIFGLCFLFDRGFQKIFRSKKQHKSGLSVGLNKKYGAFGLIFTVLGVSALFAGWGAQWILFVGGILIFLVGICLVIYYMTFGIFYDEDGFLLTTFGKKSTAYAYEEISQQQLYNSYGNIVIELQLRDGRTVHLQANMVGVYPFLDKAFAGWCRQKNIAPETCTFYDPQNSCWFPTEEEK